MKENEKQPRAGEKLMLHQAPSDTNVPMGTMVIALAGNPNSGKTTLFNALTGSTAHVGNWPGVTVEHKEGTYKDKVTKEKHKIIDLPGIYSLTPYTSEEIVTRNYLLEQKPDAIINIIDATNLERNLYLTTQLLELDIPVVLALNMMDVVEKENGKIDISQITSALSVSAVSISALKNIGLDELMAAVINDGQKKRLGKSVLESCPIKDCYNRIAEMYSGKGAGNIAFRTVKLIEGDSLEKESNPEIYKIFEQISADLEIAKEFENDFEAIVADFRYRFISSNICQSARETKKGLSKSDKADRILTHRIWGIPIFLGIMLVIFHFTFSENFLFLTIFGLKEGIMSPGVALQTWLGKLMALIMNAVSAGLVSAPSWVGGLLVDGLLGGLNAVLSFLPQILLLFVFLSILEDSGYMARVAFIMDRAFRKFGLSGKAFMPLLMCFGCAVPGIMATRTLASEKERKTAIFLTPFFSCGAKLPIWATVAAAVFPVYADLTVFGIYVLGIGVAIIAALILSKTVFKGETPPFIMELPSYRMPRARNTLMQLWDKFKHYIFRAATVIAGAIVVIWFLSNFTFTFQMTDVPAASDSMLGWIGRILRPIFIPLGFAAGNEGWKFVVAIFTGLIAKEMVVATMGVLSGTKDALDIGAGEIAGTSLGLLLSGLTGPAAFAFMAFNLLSVPCMAAVAAAGAELKKKSDIALAIAFWLLTAYVVSLAVYWLGTLFVLMGFIGTIVSILAAALVIFTIIFNVIRRKKKKAAGCSGNCSGCGGC